MKIEKKNQIALQHAEFGSVVQISTWYFIVSCRTVVKSVKVINLETGVSADYADNTLCIPYPNARVVLE